MKDARDLGAMLGELAGPLGPFTSPEQRKAEVREFLQSLVAGDVADLIAIGLSIGRDARGDDLWSDQKQLLAEEAIVAACQTPEAVLPTLTEALRDRSTRVFAIDVIGALQSSHGVTPLLGLLDIDLTHDELVAIAAALGEIGGEQARAGLEQIIAEGARSEAISHEVTAAMQNLAQP